MQNKKHNKKTKQKGIVILSIGIFLLIFFILYIKRFDPMLSDICDYKARIYAYDLINDSIDETLSNTNLTCEDFLIFDYDNSGKIQAVNSNMINANSVIGNVASKVRERYEKSGVQTEYIPIGNVIGYSTFFNKGFKMPITIEPKGWIETDILSKFTQSGINQTTVEIILKVKMTMSSQFSTYKKATEIIVTVPIAQSTVLGEIPNYVGSGVIASYKE